MSRASRLIRRLDKVLARYDSFGDDPSSFVDSVLASLDDERALAEIQAGALGCDLCRARSGTDQAGGAQPCDG